VLVADEANFAKAKRQRFLARAATAEWDCIITHTAFMFIPVSAAFEEQMVAGEIAALEEILESVDSTDRISNVPELIDVFRHFADVVQKSNLREHLKLRRMAGGKRQLVTAEATPMFRAYQKVLDQRIKAIESRKLRPEKGDDILLSVIGDGRHAAIDLRLVVAGLTAHDNSKLDMMINRVEDIYHRSAEKIYYAQEGVPYAIPGGRTDDLLGSWYPQGRELSIGISRNLRMKVTEATLILHRHHQQRIEVPDEPTALGVIARLESALEKFEQDLAEQEGRLEAAQRRNADFEPRIGAPFGFEAELESKRADYLRLEADLAAQKTDASGETQQDAVSLFEEAFRMVIRFPGRGQATVLDDEDEANGKGIDAEAG
jgi:hypothetical protein